MERRGVVQWPSVAFEQLSTFTGFPLKSTRWKMSNQIEAARVRHYRERWGRETVCNFLSPPGRHALTPANKQKRVAWLTSSKQDEGKLFHSTMSVFLTFVHLYKVGHAFMVVEKKSRRSTLRNPPGTICVFADDDFFFVRQIVWLSSPAGTGSFSLPNGFTFPLRSTHCKWANFSAVRLATCTSHK